MMIDLDGTSNKSNGANAILVFHLLLQKQRLICLVDMWMEFGKYVACSYDEYHQWRFTF
jgi:hypothetical protein